MLKIGDWLVDPALDEIRRDDEVTKLEPRMMRLLCFLAERPGDVVTATELLERVWPGVVVNPGSVYQVVAQLRKCLGDDGREARYIATVPRKGYRLIATVSEVPVPAPSAAAEAPVFETPEAGLAEGADVAAPILAKPARSRPRVWASVVASVLAIGSLTVLWLRNDAPQAADTTPKLVVLPLTDLSDDGSNTAFCDGLTDEIANALGRVPGLRVAGRTSAHRARDTHADAREIGKLLGVTHVLEGSVRFTANRLRISAQLVSTVDGFQVWSNSFDRPRTEALSIQSEISRAVVDALSIRLSAAQSEQLARAPTNVNAYELYLLGRHQQLLRTPDSIARAVAYQQQAIAADPKFALAHAGLADAYMASYYYASRPLIEAIPLAQRAVDEALRLDPELAEAYTAWGVILLEDLRNDEALRVFTRAVSINSNSGHALLGLGTTHEFSGRPLEALKVFDQVALLDPLHTQLHMRRCATLQSIGRYGEGERACQRAFELQPDIPNAAWGLGLGAYLQGDLAMAIDRYKQSLTRAPRRGDLRAELAQLYLDIGMPDQAASEFDTMSANGAHAGLVPIRARMFFASGDLNALAGELRGTDWSNTYSRVRLDASYLATLAGDKAQADAFLQSVRTDTATSEDDIRPAPYFVMWGLCEMCSLAYVERQRGEVAAAERHEQRVLDWLKEKESTGYRWHSLHYIRATLQAQRGETKAALASLERAVDMGWRRAWLMRVDPMLESVRSEARFKALLEKIEASNAQARERLLARSATTSRSVADLLSRSN